MVETLITAMQSLCGIGLVLGIALSLYQGAHPGKQPKRFRRFTFAIANDFETGYRRRWKHSR